MHPFFHKKYYILFALFIIGTVVVLYLEYHFLYTTFLPGGKAPQSQYTIPTQVVTRAVPSSTITHGPIPPQSQISPAYADILQISLGKEGFSPATASMSTKDLITFINADTTQHSITIEGRTVDVLVDGMTGQRLMKPGTFTITDTNTGSTLSLTVRE